MSDPVIDRVRVLREMGATKVRVSADGEVEADFGPATEESHKDRQHDEPEPAPVRRVTGALVPRGSTGA